MSTNPGPPWLIVIHLPDDTPPAMVDYAQWNLPDGSSACALADGPARAVLAVIPEGVRP